MCPDGGLAAAVNGAAVLFMDLFLVPLRYTAFSELLPLIAIGTVPLLKVKRISQEIDTQSLTIKNSTTISSPFASFSFSASASFEVQTPSRIQVWLSRASVIVSSGRQENYSLCR